MLRFGLATVAAAIILILLPRADHQSFTYELNQPWKYPLLTAEFDIPILRDSASARLMRDSIDRAFIPFVKKDDKAPRIAEAKFNELTDTLLSDNQRYMFTTLIRQMYERGIMEPQLYTRLYQNNQNMMRLVEDDSGGAKTVLTISRDSMVSPRQAFLLIDSLFLTSRSGERGNVNPEVMKALNQVLTPNLVFDSITDEQYRSQEYLLVTGAMGTIQPGQRIVDRGEIITPQIFTNLNTYQEKLASREDTDDSMTYYLIGQGLYILTLMSLFYIFLYVYRPNYYRDARKMIFLVSMMTFFTVFAILMFEYVANGLYIVPFAALPVIILVFCDSRTAIFVLIITVLFAALVATFPFQFIFMEVSVGLVATYSIFQLSRRSQLLRTAIFSFIAYSFTYFIGQLITNGDLSQFSVRIIGMFGINTVILSFAYVLILIIEKIFGFTSTVTLVELSDINSPVLRRLAEVAPGTFQHSIQVSTLAAEAARAIGANSTLVRTGALYHDIGKLGSPVFFTENQHGVNPHTGLDPVTSAQKIISHVTEGAAIASKEKLPPVIKSFILEHHGKGMAKYFYTTAANQSPDGEVDKKPFTYPGPNPQSVETAILMMADAVEAASRSLRDYTPEAIDNLVENIINGQAADGLYRESPISFKDVETIKQVFKKRLATIYHTRVRYPQMKKKAPSSNPKPAAEDN